MAFALHEGDAIAITFLAVSFLSNYIKFELNLHFVVQFMYLS